MDTSNRVRVNPRDYKLSGNPEIVDLIAPKEIQCEGAMWLLEQTRNSVAIVGTRTPSKRGKVFADIAASDIAKASINVISGLARGIDKTAHWAALNAGGTTTMVLPYGLSWLHQAPPIDRIPPVTQEAWDERSLRISPFHSTAGFSGKRAMERSWLVCMMSRCIIVIESGAERKSRAHKDLQGSSGTFATAKAAIQLDIPLLVVNPDRVKVSEGNQNLIELGAQQIDRPSDVLPLVEEVMSSQQ